MAMIAIWAVFTVLVLGWISVGSRGTFANAHFSQTGIEVSVPGPKGTPRDAAD
jgi:hypothetical protein